jgi:hypothetical protein
MTVQDPLERLAQVLTSDLPYDYDPEFIASLTLSDFSRLWEMMEHKPNVRGLSRIEQEGRVGPFQR